MLCVALFIDQHTDDLYIAHLGKGDGSETVGTSVGAYYHVSTDDAATWGAEVTLAATATLNLVLLSCCMGSSDAGQRFAPVWWDKTNTTLITNSTNSAAVGVAPSSGAAGALALLGVG